MSRADRFFSGRAWLLWVAILLPLVGCQDSGSPEAEEPKPGEMTAAEPELFAPSAEPRAATVEHAPGANRLAGETSPYLLMHAHNPVHWMPWGEEAFAKARREGKLIFLSIGYSSCYWCHVMERESFMDAEVARFLNDHFVAIKVDREERPDVDEIYMSALQIISGRGGWPMSMFLTPDAKPFYGGTYFRRDDFHSVLMQVDRAWRDRKNDILADAEKVTGVLRSAIDRTRTAGIEQDGVEQDGVEQEETPLDQELLDNVMAGLADSFDPTWGGFGYAEGDPRRPKFPVPSRLMFLLQQADEDEQASKMLLTTLDKMMIGGIWDHLGGGFHRYSTDRFWHIPHFEKMLYDNGQLTSVYAEAYTLTGNEEYRLIVEAMLEFVLREMTSSDGGFYAAIDAETDAEEGKFYRWTRTELDELMPGEETAAFRETYQLAGDPNFEHRYFVPMLKLTRTQWALERESTLAKFEKRARPLRAEMLAERDKRERPLTDTKVITAWNGLMIRGFADAGRVLDDQRYLDAAAKAAEYVLAKLRTDDGRLLRTYRKGQAKFNGYLDDYAFLVDGLLALHRATSEDRWLTTAEELTKKQVELFWDERSGGFFFTSHDHESLVARAKSPSDSVRPSGNSVAAENLVYLGKTFNNQDYLLRARQTISAFRSFLNDEDLAEGSARMAVALKMLLELEGERPTSE